MASDTSVQPAYVVSRERLTLTLALPFLLLFAAALVAWPWRALGLPGVAGTLTPPSILLLAATVAAAMYAFGRRLPLGMITWVPAGQGAVVLLGVGFLPPSTDENTALVMTIVVFGVVFLLALGLALAVAGHGVHLAVAFIAFFVMTQAPRFPIFEVHATEPIVGASFLTLAAALRAALELAVLAWLATRLVTAAPAEARRLTWMLVGLTLAHGLIAGWEDPVLRGELSFAEVIEQAVRWFLPAAGQLVMVTVLARMRARWFNEQPQTPAPAQEAPQRQDAGAWPLADETLSRSRPRSGGRPTPRKRRRR